MKKEKDKEREGGRGLVEDSLGLLLKFFFFFATQILNGRMILEKQQLRLI